MFRRISRLGFCAFAAFCGCAQPFDCSTLYPSADRPTKTHAQVFDNGSRRVRTEVTTAADATLLAIVSPGLGAELADFRPLAQTLAANGYAVVVVEHLVSTEHIVCGTLKGTACWTKLEESETHAENWFARFDDIKLVMAHAPAALAVDPQRIVLVGHSFGAFTMMAFGGTTFVDPRSSERQNLYDPRAVAIVAMSPQGPRWFGLDEASWSAIATPLLLMTGDKDGTDAIDDSPEWRREPFPHMTGTNKMMLRLKDGGHLAFTAREKNKPTTELIGSATLAFVDTYARHGTQPLTPAAVTACSRGRASLETRQ